VTVAAGNLESATTKAGTVPMDRSARIILGRNGLRGRLISELSVA